MKQPLERLVVVALFVGLILSFVTNVHAETDLAYEIPKLQSVSLELCVLEDIQDVVFDGNPHNPKVLLYDGEQALQENVDYQVSYRQNVDAGFGKIVITGIGKYTGELTTSFTIKKASIRIKGGNVSSNGTPKISWKKVKGASVYKVYRAKKKNGAYTYIDSTSKLNYIDQSAIRSKNYVYQVKAVDSYGKTKNFNVSNQVSITYRLSNPKVKTNNVSQTGKTKLSWGRVKGAEAYAIYRSVKKNGKYSYMTTTKKNNWIHEKAVAGKKYYYRVKAIDRDNRKADSVMSTPVLRSCDLKRPIVTLTLNQKAKPKLVWKKINGAEKYEVFRSVKKSGPYQSVGKSKTCTYTDTKAKGGKTYYYRVRALDLDNTNATSSKSITRKIYVVNLQKKLLALTFDDGPGIYTDEIVDALKNNNAKATFFVLGQNVRAFPEQLKLIHAGGNEIGNHSYSHPILSYYGKDTTVSQMNRTDKAIKSVVGSTTTIMRPPGGGISSTVQSAVGKPLIMWSIDTRDWEHRDTQTTIDCVMDEAADGDIVLMHDIHEPTMRAAVKLIPKLKKAGFELVTVSELAKYKGKKMKNGTVYYSF